MHTSTRRVLFANTLSTARTQQAAKASCLDQRVIVSVSVCGCGYLVFGASVGVRLWVRMLCVEGVGTNVVMDVMQMWVWV